MLGNVDQAGKGVGAIQYRFFSEREPIDGLEELINSSTYKHQEFRNIDPVIGILISRGKATLHELRTIYDYEDALTMWEVIVVDAINEHRAYKQAQRDAKK